MKFKPKTEDDIKREMLLEAGTYDFEILSAEDTQSKKGNDMIALRLTVFGGERHVPMRDWLLEAMAHKFRHFAYATGMGAKYEAGELAAADCVGRTGKLELVIKENPQYGPQNSVVDYVVEESDAVAAPAPKRAAPAPSANAVYDDPNAPPF